MGTTSTSRPGRTEGYVLLDALLAMLVAAVLAAAILPGISEAAQRSAAALVRARAEVAGRNELVREHIDELAP